MATYKVTKDVVKAQDMLDDRVGGKSQFAECAEVVSLFSWSHADAFNHVLHACKSTMTEERNF